MKKTDKVVDKEGKEMRIVGKMDCRTVGAIYGMWCDRCGKVVYVGKTMNRVMDRFNGHRADLRAADESKPAYHFKRNGHVDGDMKVVVLEHVPGDDDVYRVTRERWWMNRMGTFITERHHMYGGNDRLEKDVEFWEHIHILIEYSQNFR